MMKSKASCTLIICFLLPVSFLLYGGSCFAQGIAINKTGNPADSSAILDVSSTYSPFQGVLLPRLTTAQRDAIQSPAQSLLIYNVTDSCYQGYIGNVWRSIWCATPCSPPTSSAASASPNPLCEGSTLTLAGSATGATNWSWTGPNGFTSSLQNPAIINVTAGAAGVYIMTASNSCGSAMAVTTASVTVQSNPSAPAAATHVPSATQIIWNWSPVAGVSGYQWNTSNTYPGAGVNVVAGTSYTQSGLICNTAYTLYIWSYNTCGNSGSATLSASTSGCGPQTQTFNYTGAQQTFTVPAGVVSINVDAKGAAGGGGGQFSGSAGNGGLASKGGRVQTTVAVSPGETLYIYVGGAGVNGSNTTGGAGGYNGGGTGPNSTGSGGGGGGGGASDIRQGGSALTNRVVIAGGGGGGGGSGSSTSTGGDGGFGGEVSGGNGGPSSGGMPGGNGGTQSAGGIAGANATDGSLGNGGAGYGVQSAAGGGGGGGGYYGGGGGGNTYVTGSTTASGGGGGGSSYSSGSGTTHTQNYQSGNGQIILSW